MAESVEILTPEELLGPLNDVEQRNAPARLWVSGRTELAKEKVRVAIVGTRRPTTEGKKRAARLARILAGRDVIVVSGLAQGIDTEAHVAGIDAGGRTIAVIGTPLERAYPPANRELQARIAIDHLLVSQFAPGSRVQPWNFVLRNRTVALIADASVIVEAGEGSGTLSQGREALRLGRPLFLMRSVAENRSLRWPREMMDYGASILEEPDQLLESLPAPRLRELVDAPF